MSKTNREITVDVTGTLGFDYIMDFPGKFADRIMPDKIHQISLSFLVDTLKKQFGGTAGNIAYTLKLLGVEPRIIAPAGNDFEPYKKFLLRHGIDVSGILIRKDVPTSSYFVITDKEDNQSGYRIRSFCSVAMVGLAPFNKTPRVSVPTIVSVCDPTATCIF